MSTRSGFGPGFAPAPGFHPATRSPAIYAVVSVTLWVLFFLSCTVTALSFLALLGHPCMLLVHRMRLSDRGARFGNIHFWLMFCRGVNILLIFAWLVQFAVNRQNAQANDYWLPLAWVLVHLALAGKLYVHIISIPRESGRSVHGEDSVEASPPVPFLHDVPVLKVEQPCKAEDSPTATSHANNTYAIPISAFEMVMAAEGSWRPICKGEPFYRQSEYDACPPAASSTHATPSAAAAMLHPHIDGPLINIYYTVPEHHAAAPPTQTAASCALVQKARCHDVSATP